MKQDTYEWVPQRPTKRQRLIAAVWLLVFVPVLLSFLFDWHLFGGYDKWVFGGLLIASLVLLDRMPRGQLQEGRRHPRRYWIILAAVLTAVLAFSVWRQFY